MNNDSDDELKNRTIESLIFPDGRTRLAVFETKPVRKLTGEGPHQGLLWYLEDEGTFIVELAGTDRIETLEFPTVDSLTADNWVLSDQGLSTS